MDKIHETEEEARHSLSHRLSLDYNVLYSPNDAARKILSHSVMTL